MTEVIGVRFKPAGKVYYFDPAGLGFQLEDKVIVETKRGIELGTCVISNKEIDEEDLSAPLKPVIRQADEMDLGRHQDNLARARDAFDICKIKIEEHGLDMKLIDAEYTFDNNKLIFYFTADERIDFRDLVRDLAYIFKLRIELRQIGVRDQTKMVGGLGICGRVCCCSSFMTEFEPVTMNMAKDQDLSLNPSKISGICGRLMCCLAYEHQNYQESARRLPRIGSKVRTEEGLGLVEDTAKIVDRVKVRLKDKDGRSYSKSFPLSQVKVLKDCQGCQHGQEEG